MVPPRTAEDDAPAVAALLDRHPVGGLILFNGRWPTTRETLLDLQRKSDAGLLVMTDMERGLGQQVHPPPDGGPTVFPHLRAFGAMPDDEAEAAVRAFAAAGAREALAAGVHVAFAPVADVNRNANNPIIATRAFGEEPARVARLVRAYVEAARGEGLATTAKHFPGHGATAEDSHAVLPTVSDPREVLGATDLVPFRTALDAGTDLVMTAHVAYPALDPSGRPATRSRPILTGLLRHEMGFEGVVVTDSLHMGGIREASRSEAEMAAELVAAGVDLLLDPQDPEALVEGLARAVEEGGLEEERLDEALTRVEAMRTRLRTRFGEGVFRDPSLAYPESVVGAEAHRALADDVARRAVTLLEGDLPHLGQGEGVLVLLVRPHASPLDPPEQALGAAVREAFPFAVYREWVATDEEGLPSLHMDLQRAEKVVVALVVKPAAWRAFGLPEAARPLVEEAMRTRPTVLAALGSPRGLDGLEGATARLVTFSDVPASQRALAARLRQG